MAKTNAAAPVAPVLNAAVVALLDEGNTAGATADRKAREAAVLAAKSDRITVKDKAERIAAIQSDYREHLTHPTVVASFRAALVILVSGTPLQLAVAEKTELFKPEGKTLRLKGLDVLGKGEKPEAGKCVVQLTPEEAVQQLQSNDLKAVGTATREGLGIARAKGAGKPKAAAPAGRAPFMDEFSAALKDAALSASMFRFIASAAKSDKKIIAALSAILTAEGYTVRKVEKQQS